MSPGTEKVTQKTDQHYLLVAVYNLTGFRSFGVAKIFVTIHTQLNAGYVV